MPQIDHDDAASHNLQGIYTFKGSTLVGLGTLLVVALVWAAGATWFVLCRDDLVTHMLSRQAQIQYDYEGKLGALRAHLDTVASHQIVNQEGVEKRLSDLKVRQAQLETRHALVSMLVEGAGLSPTVTGSLPAMPLSAGTRVSPSPPDALMSSPKPSAKEDEKRGSGKPVPERQTLFPTEQDRDLRTVKKIMAKAFTGQQTSGSVDQQVALLEQSTSQIQKEQTIATAYLERTVQERIERLRHILTGIGLDPHHIASARAEQAPMGGPYIPATLEAGPTAFDASIERLQAAVTTVDRLKKTVSSLPLKAPLPGVLDVTSPFGYRVDPFNRSAALHTGVDFRGEYGAPVHGTAAGHVIAAEYSGGYGNMVDIDHGNGIVTRYGHLSEIDVSVGQSVENGTIIGRIGSTGRSTGAHLHYETRVSGEPVDPQKFLKTGNQFQDELKTLM